MEDEQLTVDVTAQQPEKTLSVEQVNEIVKREKATALEKARRELRAEMEQMKSGMGGMTANTDEMYATFRDRLLKEAQEEEAKRQQDALTRDMETLVGKHYQRMGAVDGMPEDFSAITAEFNPSAFPQLFYLAAQMDNSPELIYELASNPSKLATIDYLARHDPKMASSQLKKLSESITANKVAMQQPQANAPLSRLSPSAKATAAPEGDMSVRDLRGADWLRT